MNEHPRAGLRLGLVVGLIVIVLVVAAAVVNAVRPVQEFPRETPEGTVQAFLLSLNEQDYEAAHALLSASRQAEYDPADLVGEGDEATRIVVTNVTEVDERVLVDVNASFVESGSGLEPYRYDTDMQFTLVDEGGQLMIDELPYYIYCLGG